MDNNTSAYFEQYDHSIEKIKNLLKDELPRSLRLFNIRFRLAIDVQIDFKGEVSLTKTKDVKETYVLLIKLMEAWNAYEALFQYVKNTGKYIIPNQSIYKAYSPTFLLEIGCLSILKETLDLIKEKYNSDNSFKNDFIELINRIKDDTKISRNLKMSCEIITKYFNGIGSISGIETIALIYAERNMYFHNGETAKMGMKYGNRKFLIDSLLTCLYQHTLLLTIKILELEYPEGKL